MKEIKAVVQPARLAKVREAMRHVPGFPGMTVSSVDGCSAVDEHGTRSIRAELTDYSRKVRVEIVCDDALVEPLAAAIARAAHTGQKGDGILWVTEVATMRRIREG